MFVLKNINELYDNFSEKVYEANILDKKTKELIALSCSVMADCVPCIDWHYKKAIEDQGPSSNLVPNYQSSINFKYIHVFFSKHY